jgi:hypothetical protein
MNKYNPTIPSSHARTLIGSEYKGKFKRPVRTVLETVEVRLNGSIVSTKPPSRRDRRRGK